MTREDNLQRQGDMQMEIEAGVDEAMPCGCVEYHYADCPLITDRFSGPSEPSDWGEDEGRGFDGYGEDD